MATDQTRTDVPLTTVPEHAAKVAVGDKIRFDPNYGTGWWDVRDRDERYIVATRQRRFQPKGNLEYTVVDLTGWQDYQYNGAGPGVVRSSLNTLGGGWDIDPDGKGAEEIIPSLRDDHWELSHRRIVSVAAIEVKP